MLYKKQWQEIAEKEAVVATQVIERLYWLAPGTYCAKDVHHAITKRCGS